MERFRAQDSVVRASVLALAGAVVVVIALAVGLSMRGERPPLDTRNPGLAAAIGSTTEERPIRTFPRTDVMARAAIVVDLSTGEAIYSKNTDAPLPLASITKLMTVYVAARADALDDVHTLATADFEPEGDWGMMFGDTLSVRALVSAALVPSANDAAQAIALAVSNGDESAFVRRMNDEAKRLGAKDMTFRNPTGLDESANLAGAEGSARDVAELIGALAIDHRSVVVDSTKSSITIKGSFGIPYAYQNTNPIVGKIPGLIASKTGYTDLAGGNLAVVFDAGLSQPYAVVVLGSTQEGRFADVAALASSTSAYLRSGE